MVSDGTVPAQVSGHQEPAHAEPAHPGPVAVSIPAALLDELVEHARAGYPNEACGLIVGDRSAAEGGHPLRFEPTRNRAASPYRYEIDSADLLRLTLETDDRDEVFWAIVHSHVRSLARPSPTDVGLALYPDALYVIVSLADEEADPITGRPGIRAWRIVNGLVREVVVEQVA